LVDEVVPGNEAEDIFDSFVGSMAGRRQPEDPPSAADWTLLFNQVKMFAEGAPWLRWDDEIVFAVTVTFDGERRQVNAIVMGNAGIQFGLAVFPGELGETELERDPTASILYDPETLVCTVDESDQVPLEFRARAIRYGWSESAALVPSFFAVDEEGGRDFSSYDARLFAVVIAAVLSHERRHRRPSSLSKKATEGRMRTPSNGIATYSVFHHQRPG
jgi:hypothetical protein